MLFKIFFLVATLYLVQAATPQGTKSGLFEHDLNERAFASEYWTAIHINRGLPSVASANIRGLNDHLKMAAQWKNIFPQHPFPLLNLGLTNFEARFGLNKARLAVKDPGLGIDPSFRQPGTDTGVLEQDLEFAFDFVKHNAQQFSTIAAVVENYDDIVRNIGRVTQSDSSFTYKLVIDRYLNEIYYQVFDQIQGFVSGERQKLKTGLISQVDFQTVFALTTGADQYGKILEKLRQENSKSDIVSRMEDPRIGKMANDVARRLNRELQVLPDINQLANAPFFGSGTYQRIAQKLIISTNRFRSMQEFVQSLEGIKDSSGRGIFDNGEFAKLKDTVRELSSTNRALPLRDPDSRLQVLDTQRKISRFSEHMDDLMEDKQLDDNSLEYRVMESFLEKLRFDINEVIFTSLDLAPPPLKSLLTLEDRRHLSFERTREKLIADLPITLSEAAGFKIFVTEISRKGREASTTSVIRRPSSADRLRVVEESVGAHGTTARNQSFVDRPVESSVFDTVTFHENTAEPSGRTRTRSADFPRARANSSGRRSPARRRTTLLK